MYLYGNSIMYNMRILKSELRILLIVEDHELCQWTTFMTKEVVEQVATRIEICRLIIL